jgi:Fe-Mn family superoxide dismutase
VRLETQPALRFNGGGHINHSIFWTNLAPRRLGGGELPAATSPLMTGIVKQWGCVPWLRLA